MTEHYFDSAEAYEQAFVAGLKEMLQGYDELGVFILVLANALIEPGVWSQMEDQLRLKFDRFAAQQAKGRGLSLDDAQDDQRVFQRLVEMGFDNIGPIRTRRCGPWELQFNPLRSLRPARMVAGPVKGISAPFNPDQFHFARPFLRKETFWRGQLAGRAVSLLYNKFPFVRMMGLLVPEIRDGRPQLLHEADFMYACELLHSLSQHLPDIGIGYNSYGAYASVNHLHFHLFLRSRPLPVAAAEWLHNGGGLPYAANCLRFDEPREAWGYLLSLHGSKTPYNLILLPDRIYCLPRSPQGTRALPAWSGGHAWFEMAGCFVPQEEAAYETLEESVLAHELSTSTI